MNYGRYCEDCGGTTSAVGNDPAVLDSFPSPSWGGEWADEPTFEDLARDHGLTEAEAEDVYPAAVDAFHVAASFEIERAALVLAGRTCSTCGRLAHEHDHSTTTTEGR